MPLHVPNLPLDTAVVTVVLDATRTSPDGAEALTTRVGTLSADLLEQGASEELVEVVAQRAEQPTGAPGPHGRVLVASIEGVHVDRLLSEPPASDSAVLARGGDILALAKVSDDAVHWALVEVDRTGADLSTRDTSDPEAGTDQNVEADHNVLTKNRLGGPSHRRIHARAEDSWERNADQVAEAIDALMREESPELVLLTGDVRMVALVREAVGEPVQQALHVLESGSRADGVHAEAFEQEFSAALDQWRARRREAVLDRYREQAGKDGAAVAGLEDVFEVLRRGQVEQVLISEDALDAESRLRTTSAWIGPEGIQGGLREQEVTALGAQTAQQVPAHIALGRLILATDAGVTLVDSAALNAGDGIAALLRWDDDATPSQSAQSQTRGG